MHPHSLLPAKPPHQSGFSLIELSIVLTIIALLAGGIFVGQNVLRGAKLKSISTEYATYQQAFSHFRDKYMELPGDMSQATDYWGAAANCPGTSAQGTTDGTTCNGDGNGLIERDNVSPTSNEWFRAWQHLANADLIDGVYNGVTGSGHAMNHSVVNFNVPQSAMADNIGWSVRWLGEHLGNSNLFAHHYGHMFYYGVENTAGATADAFIKPKELHKIDTKIDDGKPGTGKVLVRFWDECTDATGSAVADAKAASYLLSVDDEACGILFPNAF